MNKIIIKEETEGDDYAGSYVKIVQYEDGTYSKEKRIWFGCGHSYSTGECDKDGNFIEGRYLIFHGL